MAQRLTGRRSFGALALAAAFGALGVAAQAAAGEPEGAQPQRDPRVLAPPTPEQAQSLEEERADDLQRFVQRAADFRETVDSTVKSVLEIRQRMIEAKYAGREEQEAKLEREALSSAIEYFEAFLKKYPDDPPYTPDAMFRLAELYYDYSANEYNDKFDRYREGGAGAADGPPDKEFDRTIAMFRELIRRYPDYKDIDGAYYLLGWCLKDTGKMDEARLVWLHLVCANKYAYDPAAFAAGAPAPRGAGAAPAPERPARPSESLRTGAEEEEALPAFVDPFEGCTPLAGNDRFFFEAWWHVGEYYFEAGSIPFAVETAIAAYKRLVTDPSHKWYDTGLYKLAWSYYKANMFPESIRTFSQLVDYSDAHNVQESSMRPEAIQYLAVCFYTDDWNGDQAPDPVGTMERLVDPTLMPQDRPWTREVYMLVGDIYAENEKLPQAIAVWRLFLEKWPLDVQAPFVQSRIADAYDLLRQPEEALAERGKLDAYGKGSAWWNANEDHPEAQNQVANMAQDALIEAAERHHENARVLRQKGKVTGDEQILEFALEEYNLAAAAYRKYLEQNPDTPNAYDLNLQLADALFWSGQYAEAKIEYLKVRDSNVDNRHREESARMVILCIENIMANEKAAGRLALREAPPPLEGEPPLPGKVEMPPLLLELMTERDNYLKYNPGSPQTATFEYQSAQNYYRYGYWDEAKRRYEDVYNKYCKKDELSFEAWKVLLNMATDQNSLDEKERLALLEQQQQCAVEGAKLSEDGAIDLGSLLGDVAMQRAMDKFAKCRDGKDPVVCTEAGDELVAAVAKAPRHQSADAALHNAAVAYENAMRFESAMQIYGRIINEYPDSKWVDKCLFMQASAADSLFDYEKALDNYRILADSPRFKESEYRENAIYNSAYTLTNLQSYREAIPYWQRYSSEVEDEEKRIASAFNAADMLYRAGAWADAVKAYGGFVSRYERTLVAGPYVVKAAWRTAEAEGKRGKHAAQVKAWKWTVDLYKRLVNQPGSASAEYAAHAHFLIIEEDMREFEKFQIKGSQKKIDQLREEGALQVQSFETRYREVLAYGHLEWSLAAEFRIGYAYEIYAKATAKIPLPSLDEMLKAAGLSKQEIKLIKSMPEEKRAEWQAQIEEKIQADLDQAVAGMEAKAQAQYKVTIEHARAGNISNEWTILALERMNAYDPDNYPRQHNGIVELGYDAVAVPPWAGEVE